MCPSKCEVFMHYKVWNYLPHLMTTEHSLVLRLLCVASLSHRNANPGVSFRDKHRRLCILLPYWPLVWQNRAQLGYPLRLKSPDDKVGEEEREKATFQGV